MLRMVIYILGRIVYYKYALRIRNINEIIGQIHSLKGSRLKTEYPVEVFLYKAHLICNKIQRRIMRDKRPCLVRALILYEICCRQGMKAELVVGAAKVNQKLEGHAWLEIDGVPYYESTNTSDYVEMMRFHN